MNTVELLLSRRSVTAKDMLEPGPNPEELMTILRAAHRVPDHGKLGPWRFVIFEGDSRKSFGDKLASIYAKDNPEASQKLLDFQRALFTRAPLVIGVISTATEHVKIPIWEQVLSAGAACQNMLVAASALGYASQWLTEWYSYSDEVNEALNLEDHHKIAGFIYIGSSENKPEDRVRPSLEDRISYWT